MKLLKFPVNSWNHLYSLEQAIINSELSSANQLGIHGRIRNNDYLDRIDTDVDIHFQQTHDTPDYSRTTDQQLILGQVTRHEAGLVANLQIDSRVFNELKKNLLEYADIEGIHIMITLGILDDTSDWAIGTSRALLKLDYAMKGDA